ncbi:MAG: VOC family protein [Cellulosilyticaceae bacterium]
MNFCWVTLTVHNMEASLKFYHDIIGLEILKRFNAGEDLEIAMLGKNDGTKVELLCHKSLVGLVHREGISIGFEVQSLDNALALVKANNIPIKRGPLSPIPSTQFFFIDDPNGIEVQIVEHKK